MGTHPRYIVMSMRVAAGSFMTATAVATVVVMGSAPASAANASLSSAQVPARAVAGTTWVPRDTENLEASAGQGITGLTSGVADGAGNGPVGADVQPAGAGNTLGAAPAARVDDIRREMDQAVQMRLVTADQADRFVNQMQERIFRGL